MPCHSPLSAFQHTETREVTFRETANTRPLTLRCGQCRGCRLEKSRQWAIRCMHEAQMHRENCFVTLTYADEELPKNGSLDKSHLQKFFKRLRKNTGKEIRYYACGEYGDETQRAHYHACIFGHSFADQLEYRQIGDVTLYMSDELNRLWGHGGTTVGELNFQTAAYTARYVMKKQTGLAKKGGGYATLDPQTGEITHLVQPYAVMSLRHAIGKTWIQKFHGDIYNADKDHIVVKGKKQKAPSYYDKIYDTINPEHMAIIKAKRYQATQGLSDQELRAHAENARARHISRKQI